MKSVPQQFLDTVQKLYIAYYQRPADPKGLLYWAEKLEENGGNLEAIVKEFANSPEAQQLYGDKPVEEVIKEIYESIFGREPDPEGLSFYKEKVESGEFGLEDVMLRVLDGAKGDDAVVLDKKVLAAHKFVEAIYPDLNGQPDLSAEPEIVKYEGFKDAQEAREWLKKTISSPDAVVPDIEQVKVDLLAIADPDDPIVDQVKDLVVKKPDMVDELEKAVSISPDEEMLQIVKEIKTHLEEVANQLSEQVEQSEGVPLVENEGINPELLEQLAAKLSSIEKEIQNSTSENLAPSQHSELSTLPEKPTEGVAVIPSQEAEAFHQNHELHSGEQGEPVVVVEEKPENHYEQPPSEAFSAPPPVEPPPPPPDAGDFLH
jgi:hypothetical protein